MLITLKVKITHNIYAGWFSRDPVTLNRVGKILLQLPDQKLVQPSQVLIAEDCFKLSSIPTTRVTNIVSASIEKLFGSNIFRVVYFLLHFRTISLES